MPMVKVQRLLIPEVDRVNREEASNSLVLLADALLLFPGTFSLVVEWNDDSVRAPWARVQPNNVAISSTSCLGIGKRLPIGPNCWT
jgi:hypothetical protein